MALRAPHGAAAQRGAPGPRVEVLPADELPDPVQGGMQPPPAPRAAHPTALRSGDARSLAIQSAGGRAKAGKVSLGASLGLRAEHSEAFKPYARKAASFRRAHTAELAAIAGGTCGTGPSSMVASAALQLAYSRMLFDLGTGEFAGIPGLALNLDNIKLASKLADSSRQNLLAAYELAIREGKSRGGERGVYDIDEVTRRAEAEAERRRAPRLIESSGE